MLIFAEILTWHENYGQAGKKIAYFCHINSTSRNLNTALWSNCRLPTYRFSFYMQILLDFYHWLTSCDVHLLDSAFKFTQTPATSREHSRLPRAHGLRVDCVTASAQTEYHSNAPLSIIRSARWSVTKWVQTARETSFIRDQRKCNRVTPCCGLDSMNVLPSIQDV